MAQTVKITPALGTLEFIGNTSLAASTSAIFTGDTAGSISLAFPASQGIQITGFLTVVGNITATTFIKSGGTAAQFLKADGSVDATSYVPASRTLTINGVSYDLTANRSWTISTADGYISNVQLTGNELRFTGEGNAFTGTIDLSSIIPTEADTLDSVTDRGSITPNTIDVGGVKSDYFLLDILADPTQETGMVYWNDRDDTANLRLSDGVDLRLGQDQHWYVKAANDIAKGQVVMAAGTDATSGHIIASQMIADGSVEERYVLGIATKNIATGEYGHVVAFGKVYKLNLSLFQPGDVLFCDPNDPGQLTNVEPTAPQLAIPIAFVVNNHAQNGVLAVRVLPGYHLGELHDVNIVNAATGQLLRYNGSAWANWTPNFATPADISAAIAALVDSAPTTLDTLNELAAALGDDPNFVTTITNSIATKLPLAGGTMTGNINFGATDLGITWNMNTDAAYIKFFNTGDGDTNSRLEYSTADNGNEYHRWMISSSEEMTLKSDGLRVTDSIWMGGNLVATQSWVGAQGYHQDLEWDSANKNLSISNGNTVTLEGLATEEFVTSQGYLTSYTETDPFRVTAAAVTGTTTKTLTLTRADSSTVTATWTDYDSDTNTFVNAASFSTSDGILTLTRNDAGTVTVDLDGRYQLAGSYLTAESDTLATVTARGNSTTGDIIINGTTTIQNGGYLKLIAADSAATGFSVFNAEQNGYLSNKITTDSHERGWGWELTSGVATQADPGVFFRVGYNGTVSYLTSGRFGFGTTEPSSLVNIVATGNDSAALVIQDNARKVKIGRDQIQVTDLSDVASTMYLQPNANLVINGAAGAVGIGVQPTEKLTVSGNIQIFNETGLITDYGPLIGRYNTSQVYVGTGGSYSIVKIGRGDSGALNVLSGGSVGIGTDAPLAKLQVAGSIYISGASNRLDLEANALITGQYYANGNTELTYLRMYNSSNASINIGTKHNLGYISFESGNGSYIERMRITNTGKIGVGTPSPTALFTVNGTTAGESLLEVYGTNGLLFAVSDDLSNSLFSANTIAGLPVIEAFADGSVVLGPFATPVTVTTAGQINTTSHGNSSQWLAGYNDRIVSAAVSGGPTKTLTLTQQDGGTVTASWSDTDTDTNTFLTNATFNTANGVLTLTRNDAVTVTVDLDDRYLTSYENNYISTVALNGSNLRFTGEGAGFTGDIDLSALGYLTSYTETDTLATVTSRGATTSGSIYVNGDIFMSGTATAANQARTIDFTGFDKEGTTDFSDRAYIQHTVNTGGHAGSVLVISSQNDADDGIAFLTNASSKLKHNSNNIATEAWVTSQGYITSETDSQTLSWDAGAKNLSISNGNTITLDGLATEEFVTSQGYITGYTETDTLATVTGRGNSTTTALYLAGGSGEVPALHIRSGGSSWSEGLAIHPSTDSGYALSFYRTRAAYTDQTNTWAIGNLGDSNALNHFGLLRKGLTGGVADRAGDAIFTINPTGAFKFGFNPYVGTNVIWHAGNDGSGSGLDADLLDGYNSDNFIGKNGNTYFQLTTWLQSTGTHGFYSPSSGAGTHFFPDATTYGSFKIEGGKNGFRGIELADLAKKPTWMWDGSGGGMYSQADSIWYYYYSISGGTFHIGSSTENRVWHSGNFTDNSSNWNAAYNDRITAVSVSGGPTKTITLTQQDGGTLTASWSDTDTDTNTYLTSASFNTTNGILTLTRSDSATVTVDLDGRFYTQTEADGRYVNVTGDVMTGSLGISTSTAGSDAFYVDGTYGRLFTVTDELNDAVFSVNTISGLPIIEAYSDYSVKMGRYGQNDFYINPSGNIGLGTASPIAKFHIKGNALDNIGLAIIENDYASGDIYYPGLSVINTRGNHSYGIVAEFRTNAAGDTDRPSILFYGEQASHSWQLGQGSPQWTTADSFNIGYRASNDPTTFGAWPTSYFTILANGDIGVGTTTPGYKVDITGSLRLSGTIYVGGYIEQDGQSMNLRKVNSITFAPNNTWDQPYNHGIMSTDLNATNSDAISINSYNDITLRIDSNGNNSASYVRFMNDSTGNNQFAYIGYDGSNYIASFTGNVFAGSSFRAPIFYDSVDTNYYVDPNSSSVLYSTNINRAQITNDVTTSSGQGRFGGWYTGTGYTGAAVEVGFSGSSGYVIAYNRDAAAYQPLTVNGSNIYLNPVGGSVYINTSPIIRQSAGTGWLSGNYASSETVATTGAIYSIGGSYYPTSTSLNTMYGVGYTHSDQGAMPTGASSWGFYVAGNGTVRVWLGGDNGNIIATGNIYAETNRIVATQAWVSAQGYLTSLPSHNHDDRYYTETESDARYYLATNPSGYITSSALSGYATQTYVNTAISDLVASAPDALDTLNELAAALGDDANFATNITNSIAGKQAQLNGTGFVKVSGTTVSYDNSTYLTSYSETDTLQSVTNRGSSTTNQIYINNASPTLYLQDTDNRSAMIHVNSDYFYILNGSGNNSTSWAQQANSRWLFMGNLNSNDITFGGAGDFAGVVTGTAFRVSTSSNNTNIVGGNDWGVKFQNDSGYIHIGPANDSYAHIYTDRSSFYFNRDILVNGTSVSLSGHTHDDRYYTETEIGNFFSGSSAITGYNKSNWDTAFGWGNHASAGYQAASTAITTSNIGSQSVSYATSAGNADTVDSLHASSFVRNDVSQPTVQRHFDASTTWTNDAITLFLGWYGGKVVIGNNNETNHDAAAALGGNTIAITNTLYSFEQSNLYYDGSLKLYMGSDGTRNTGWAYHTNNGTGLHWPNNGWHLMPASTADFRIYSGSGSESALRFETSGTTRGYVYANSSNEIGFLNNDRTWRLRVYPGGAVESYGDFRAPIFYDSDDTNYYGNFASTSRFSRLLVQQAGVNSTAGPALRVSKGWDNGTPDIVYDTVVIESNDVTAIRMKESDGATAGWSTGDGYTSFTTNRPMRFFTGGNEAGYIYSGQGGTLAMYINNSQQIGMGTSDPLAKLHIVGATSGADVFAVDGINGRLFTVTDDLSDSLFSVNTIAGLPIIEVFANNKVTIGKYGANSITIDNSRIAINSDTVDTNFPFYVGDRSTAGSRYILANKGMGFNLADDYAQLQLYGGNGGYIDFVTSSVDSSGRIMWNGNFVISGNTYFNNTLYTYTLYDRDDQNYYIDMNGTSRLGTVNANELRSYGNTYLGDGNGDETHINDVVRIGATDSGDAHLYFGEGGSAGSDYGAHWYWDSGYRFYWYSRNAGTDTTLFYYDTNATSYIVWNRSHNINNLSLDYVAQVYFNAGTRFSGNDTHYLNFRTEATDYGSIQVRDGNNSLRGYLGYFDANGFGFLSADGSWAARATNSEIELYHITLADDMRANIYYDRNNTNYYLDPTSNTALRTVGSWRADSADWDGEFAGKIQYHSNSWYFQARSTWFFRNEGGENVMTGDSDGNFTINGILTENSSLRYKENIQDFAPALDKVEKLRPVTYNKIGQDQIEVGLIAEEVAELYPEVVNYDELGRPDGINYTRLSVILLKSLQELNNKIKKLES